MATHITTLAGLQAMEDDLTEDYILDNNIDASATSGWNAGAGFDPIGVFTGSFDGGSFTISDLYIYRPTETYVGLFASINTTGEIKNISLTSCDIRGDSNTGALGGLLTNGVVSGCSSTGSISGSTSGAKADTGGLFGETNGGSVTECSSTCTVTGDYQVGGLIGDNDSTLVTECFAKGAITGNYDVGGFVGINREDVTESYSRGAVTGDDGVGGFIGSHRAATVDNCYSSGAVTGNVDVGGFIGEQTIAGTITNCFWDITASGQTTSDGGTGKTTSEMKAQATFTGAGWDFDTIWTM